jgi:cytochrome c553
VIVAPRINSLTRSLAVILFLIHSGALCFAEPLLKPFLSAYCIQCHGPEKQKGDRRFDSLAGDPSALDEAEMLQDILDQLNLGEMPPEGKKQPSESELKEIVGHLTKTLKKARETARENSGKAVLRRLNRAEYRNTIRDLFSLNIVDFDPTVTFPPDDSVEGFDNVGEGLVTSDYLLHNYLQAARKVAEKAIRPGPRPQMIHYHSEGEEIGGTIRGFRPEIARMTIKLRQPLGLKILDKKRGVPADGTYVIRVKALAHHRKSRYKDEDLRYNSDEPMRMSISIDNRELGATAHRTIGEFEIPDQKTIEIEHRVWLDKGFTFHLHWSNGPNGSFKRIMRKVLPKYTADAIAPLRNPPEMYIGSGPELHVYSVEIEGPFYDDWPLPGFARYFPNPPEDPDLNYLDASLTRLARQAFRRPVAAGELAPYLALVRRHFQENRDFWAAAKFGVRAILSSPNFIYLAEGTSGKLNPSELASRLSYFLWSSMPDSALQKANLTQPEELRTQVERMLRDPKSASFVRNFSGQWLGLRTLGEMPPDPEKNRTYYADDLESAMREETRRFFRHLLAGNRSILEFVDADYTFLNAALARHYQIPNVTSESFERVSLQPEHHRGGLLGQGSVLTATSNGIETQPVMRGVWILENLLGTPPNPPPPDVEPIEPDTRGLHTIRELMDKHRDNPTCFECHRKIDPLGLAMEHFDHVGAWRERYGKNSQIDPAGEMPDGTRIGGPDGIRSYLLARPDQFTRCLTKKLFVYALGRRVSFTDRADIDRIVAALPNQNYGLRELVQQVVSSRAFQSK